MIGSGEYVNNEMNTLPNIDIIKNSYISKEKFISMLNNLDFICIEECDIRCITGFVYDGNENKVNAKSYKIYIC